MQSQFLYGSDNTLTVRTSNEHSETVTTWQAFQQGRDVVVRQLTLGTHKGLGRFEGLFNKQRTQATMDKDLGRLKSFVETGEIPGKKLKNVASSVQPDNQ